MFVEMFQLQQGQYVKSLGHILGHRALTMRADLGKVSEVRKNDVGIYWFKIGSCVYYKFHDSYRKNKSRYKKSFCRHYYQKIEVISQEDYLMAILAQELIS